MIHKRNLINFFLDTGAKSCPKWDPFRKPFYQMKKILHIHEYFCSIHLLVAKADTSEVSLKSWEGSIINGPKKVGSQNHDSYKNAKSSPLRLTIILCKLIKMQGHKKT